MEHAVDVRARLRGLGDGGVLVSMWDAQRAGGLPAAERAILHAILGELGARSATAQGLGAPITDLAKLEANGGQRLYLAAQRQSSTSLVVFGGLKVGEKRLFVWPPGERQQREVLATCVLDFYVHESVQCMGIGHQLFDAFLEAEELQPGALAYDLPSPKLLAFMTKHYGLHSPISFTNSFAVFPPFIETAAAGSAGAAAGGARRPPASSCWESVAARPLTSHGHRRGARQPPIKLSHAAVGLLPVSPGRLRGGASPFAPSAPWAHASTQQETLPPLMAGRQPQGGMQHDSGGPRRSPARAIAHSQRDGSSMRDCMRW